MDEVEPAFANVGGLSGRLGSLPIKVGGPVSSSGVSLVPVSGVAVCVCVRCVPTTRGRDPDATSPPPDEEFDFEFRVLLKLGGDVDRFAEVPAPLFEFVLAGAV